MPSHHRYKPVFSLPFQTPVVVRLLFSLLWLFFFVVVVFFTGVLALATVKASDKASASGATRVNFRILILVVFVD